MIRLTFVYILYSLYIIYIYVQKTYKGRSVFLPGTFLGIVFSVTQHGFRGTCGVVHDRSRFFENNIFALKMGKADQA